MSSALLYRLSGTALVLGALLSVAYHVLHPGGSGLDYFAHPATPLSHLVGFVAVLLVLLGLPGLHAHQARGAGVAGLIGTVLVFFGLSAVDLTHGVMDATTAPALATLPDAERLLAAGGPYETALHEGLHGSLVGVGGPMLLVGLILLGIATIRGGVLPRWAGALPIVAALSVPIGFVLPALQVAAFTLPYLALGGLGWLLAVRSGTPARPEAAPAAAAVR